VTLDSTEARHLTGALRRRTGDEIVLADGEGCVAAARLVRVVRGRVEAEVFSVRRAAEPKADGVTVALAMVGRRAMDWAVQKAVEIGVQRFVPIATERAQLRSTGPGTSVDHWRRISLQALKQCRRPWAMEVAGVVSVNELVEAEPAKAGAVADRRGCAIGKLSEGEGQVLAVGPEGGFTEQESALFDRHGWVRLCLGPYVLRAETAAIVGGAMMVARSEDLTVES
jgi:16S rRNA (uracil1498-N3)-methyltransferase